MKTIHTVLTMLFVVAAVLLGETADARFLANDPMPLDPENPATFNRYAYSWNDPVNMVDPNGENPVAGAAIGCAATGPGCPVGAAVGAAVGLAATIGGIVVLDEVIGNISESRGSRKLGELETIDGPGHNEPRPGLEGLSDDELIETVVNPEPGQEVKVRGNGNTTLDGNGRVKELQGRGIDPDMDVPVDELPNDPIAPWEQDL